MIRRMKRLAKRRAHAPYSNRHARPFGSMWVTLHFPRGRRGRRRAAPVGTLVGRGPWWP